MATPWDGSSHGLCTTIRDLSNRIRMDQRRVDAAPLGPIQKKRLQAFIESQRQKLKEVRAKYRAYLAGQKKKP